MKKQHVVFDTEIIGLKNPVFLVCTKIVETGETQAFWHHKRGDLARFQKLLTQPNLTWVSFNGIKFDAPLLAAWINGRPVETLKLIAMQIIEQRMMPWEAYKLAGIDGLAFDHIDLIEVAPGVMVSLKTYAGRMHYPSMIDLPFHHDQDLTPAQCKVLETYCKNDLGVTEALFKRLDEEITLREQLGARYGLELRSKSGAQVAEAILRKTAGLGKATMNRVATITYTLPPIIKLKNKALKALAERLEGEVFRVDGNGSPELPDWMDEPIELHGGIYKVGIGGLHSQHDQQLYVEADDEYEISDIDGESYYPNTIIKCGLIPRLGGNKGEKFLEAYEALLQQRVDAKHAAQEGQNQINLLRTNPENLNHKEVKKEYLRLSDRIQIAKAVAKSLKLAVNGTFGKLGNIYCSFYSPDLMLATTLTGQLNLLNLIDAVSRIKGVRVLSANTDGIMVHYPKAMRDELFKAVDANSKQTGFKYEETRYSKAAMKDVNNYLAIKTDGEIKAKGLYAPLSLEKNPTAPVCALAAAAYLQKGVKPATFIKRQKKLEPFLSIRAVKGGGIQHTRFETVDDWELRLDTGSARNEWYSPTLERTVHRKSKPDAAVVGVGGKPFGRVARWYMSTRQQPPITYVSNGNAVPLTEGAQLCMSLPSVLPADLDHNWYIKRTYEMLRAMGVDI